MLNISNLKILSKQFYNLNAVFYLNKYPPISFVLCLNHGGKVLEILLKYDYMDFLEEKSGICCLKSF